MDIVGKQHRNTERIKKSLQDREARLLARAEMEKKRLARAAILQASARDLVEQQMYDPVMHTQTQIQAQAPVSDLEDVQVSQQVVEQSGVTASEDLEVSVIAPTHTIENIDLQELLDTSADLQNSRTDSDQTGPGYRNFSEEDLLPGHESYFDLAESSSLQEYKRSLGATQQETEESFVTTVTHAPDLSQEHVFKEEKVQEQIQDQEQDQEQEQDHIQGQVQEKPVVSSVGLARPAGRSVSGLRAGLGALFLCGLVVGLLIFSSLTLIDIGFWVFFFTLIIWRIDSRLSIGLALVSLIAIPLLLLSARAGFDVGEVWAEIVAVWAYLFLVIGVVVQIWEYATKAREKVRDEVRAPETPVGEA